MINNTINYKFFKDFTNHRKKTSRAVAFSCKLSPILLLNTGTTDEKSVKQESLRQLLKCSASTSQKSGSHFFRTNTGIQSGPGALDESRLVMTFLTILKVIELLCSFRLVLEEKTGKEITESSKLEFLEKILANTFVNTFVNIFSKQFRMRAEE